MKFRLISIIVIIAFISGLAGCASVSEEHRGAATGAGIGAATGAVAGALLGHHGAKTEMAIVGGLLGALAGGLIGHYAYDQKTSREETAQKYDYRSARGTMVRIEEVAVSPRTVRAGDEVNLYVTYAVLEPSPESEIEVTETREIRHNEVLIGEPEVTVTQRGGTVSSRIPLTIPSDAERGKYTVRTTIRAGGAKDSRETSFTVD